jgi:hypothetical protein
MEALSGLIFFVYLIAYRGVSGLQNGEGYAQRWNRMIITNVVMMIHALVATWYCGMLFVQEEIQNYVYYLGLFVWFLNFVSVAWLWHSFKPFNSWIPKDIHFAEFFITASMVMGWVIVGGDLLDMALSVAPGMVLHKGFVNKGNGLPFIDEIERTDDPTGKTYSIPLLGIKVPRLVRRGWVRLGLAAFCILLFIVNQYFFKLNLNIHNIVQWL